MNRQFFEGHDIIPLCIDADANSDITGDWIRLRDYRRVTILLVKGGSEDVDDLGLQFLQATSAAGANSKALLAGRKFWYKTGTLTSVGQWTAGSVTDNDGLGFGASLTPTGFSFARAVPDVNTDQLMLAVEIETSQLDIDNGFGWITAFVEGDNVNNSCLLSIYAILSEPINAGAVPPNCIA